MIKMSFPGYNYEDFIFFIDREERKRRNLKNKMKILWEAVRNRLSTDLANKFQFGRVGILRRNAHSCWASFSENEDFPRYTHISIAFSLDGLRIWLNTETVPAMNKLKNNIERDPLTFSNLLTNLMEEKHYSLKLIERERNENTPLPANWRWFTVIESRYSDASILTFLYAKMRELKYPVFHVETMFDVRTIGNRELLMSDDLLDFIVVIINDLVPLHDFANT